MHISSLLRRLALPAAAVTMTSVAVVGLTSNALFTAQDTVDGNIFTTGTVTIDATPATAAVTMTGMAPGDSKSGSITVKNTGSLAQRYAVTGATTGDAALASALQVSASVGGTNVYTGSLAAFKIGSPTQGTQAGDRPLAAAAQEIIDITVTLPLSADNTLQGKTTTATFTFDAEQTKNN